MQLSYNEASFLLITLHGRLYTHLAIQMSECEEDGNLIAVIHFKACHTEHP